MLLCGAGAKYRLIYQLICFTLLREAAGFSVAQVPNILSFILNLESTIDRLQNEGSDEGI